MNNRKELSCLRCGRILGGDEIRCKVCIEIDDARPQRRNGGESDAAKPDGTSNGSKTLSSSDTVLGILGLVMFGGIVILMALGFLLEASDKGLLSAVKNKPAILWVLGTIGIIMMLGSRDALERAGLGLIHKILRVAMWAGLFLIVIGLLVSILGEGLSSGPSHPADNFRF